MRCFEGGVGGLLFWGVMEGGSWCFLFSAVTGWFLASNARATRGTDKPGFQEIVFGQRNGIGMDMAVCLENSILYELVIYARLQRGTGERSHIGGAWNTGMK